MTESDAGQLVVRLNQEVVQTVALDQGMLTIGRLPGNALPLDRPTVSGRHAELRVGPDGAIIVDHGSRNGTVVDGVALQADMPHLLADGAVILIGPYALTYVTPRSSDVVENQQDDPPPVVDLDPMTAGVSAPAAGPAPAVAERPVPRPDSPWLDLDDSRESRYMRHLPIIFQESDFLRRYLLGFEPMWEPLEQQQDHIAAYFDPRTAPAQFLPWLASWLDFSFPPDWPAARRRRLLTEAFDLYRWRGTRYGLERMIEVCTGLRPHVAEELSTPFVFRVSLTIPPDSDVDRTFVEALIRAHKPAHAGYILEATEAAR